jgi:hypothetical protein
MKISTYLSAIVKAEQGKAWIINIRPAHAIGIVVAEDDLAIRYRWRNRISETAQRRLLAVSEKAIKPLADLSLNHVGNAPGHRPLAFSSSGGYVTVGDVRRARRALGMK